MSELKQLLLKTLNYPLGPFGAKLVPTWKLEWWRNQGRFEFAGREFQYFFHSYNCGWPPFVSERSVELSLADYWLTKVDPDQVIEIGAVTPYYWPRRVRQVIDPFDQHSLVTSRTSLFNEDFTGKTVLSISTIEHVGTGDYSLRESLNAVDAMKRLFAETSSFLVTVPHGYNHDLDAFLHAKNEIPDNVTMRFVIRVDNESWREEFDHDRASLPFDYFGLMNGRSARSIVVLERGSLFGGTP